MNLGSSISILYKNLKSYEFTIIRRRTEIFERRIPKC